MYACQGNQVFRRKKSKYLRLLFQLQDESNCKIEDAPGTVCREAFLVRDLIELASFPSLHPLPLPCPCRFFPLFWVLFSLACEGFEMDGDLHFLHITDQHASLEKDL